MKLNRQTASSSKSYPTHILQFGEGNFLRAFVDWMINKMNHQIEFNTGIDIIQPLPNGLANLLNEQDGLFHVLLRGIKEGNPIQEYSLIDCINQTINPYSEFEKYEQAILNPELRFVVSNTTEAGICWNETDTLEMQPPVSFPAKVTALLYQRFKKFNGDPSKGLIFFACELIDRNGDMLRKYVVQHAQNWNLEVEFSQWINQTCCFCNTLVDRIVPGFPKDEIKAIQDEIGFEDNLVVVGEYFHFWVIEAPDWVQHQFPAQLAGLDVKFVEDMTRYREQKVLVLNGCHTGSFAVSYLSGLPTVREAYENETIGMFMQQLVYNEVLSILEGTDEELKQFAKKILERFKNPYIKHLWQSIALNAMSKWETRNLPTLLNYHQKFGSLPKRTVFSLAAMIAYYRGEVNGEKYTLQDDQWVLDFYAEAWSTCDLTTDSIRLLVKKVLSLENHWKQNLNLIPSLTNEVWNYLSSIIQKGMNEAVKEVL